MKEFNIEDLEVEKINTIEIEKHFFKINKEDKEEFDVEPIKIKDLTNIKDDLENYKSTSKR